MINPISVFMASPYRQQVPPVQHAPPLQQLAVLQQAAPEVQHALPGAQHDATLVAGADAIAATTKVAAIVAKIVLNI